jgi:hypothetical protein
MRMPREMTPPPIRKPTTSRIAVFGAGNHVGRFLLGFSQKLEFTGFGMP